MIATESATTNQQGQLTPDQRATIGGWLTGQQLRMLPALLPLAALLALAISRWADPACKKQFIELAREALEELRAATAALA